MPTSSRLYAPPSRPPTRLIARDAGGAAPAYSILRGSLCCASCAVRSTRARRPRPGQPRRRGVSRPVSGRPTRNPVRLSGSSGHRTPVVVVGSGPAGLFAALRLIELRPAARSCSSAASDVSARKRDIARINRNGAVDPDTNYAFGEGGAGYLFRRQALSPAPKSAATTASALEASPLSTAPTSRSCTMRIRTSVPTACRGSSLRCAGVLPMPVARCCSVRK